LRLTPVKSQKRHGQTLRTPSLSVIQACYLSLGKTSLLRSQLAFSIPDRVHCLL
jgi:hypothetical protein